MSFPSSEREFDSRHPLHREAPGRWPGARRDRPTVLSVASPPRHLPVYFAASVCWEPPAPTAPFLTTRPLGLPAASSRFASAIRLNASSSPMPRSATVRTRPNPSIIYGTVRARSVRPRAPSGSRGTQIKCDREQLNRKCRRRRLIRLRLRTKDPRRCTGQRRGRTASATPTSTVHCAGTATFALA